MLSQKAHRAQHVHWSITFIGFLDKHFTSFSLSNEVSLSDDAPGLDECVDFDALFFLFFFV